MGNINKAMSENTAKNQEFMLATQREQVRVVNFSHLLRVGWMYHLIYLSFRCLHK